MRSSPSSAQGYRTCCHRCEGQIAALAGNGGQGDRPLLAGTLTMAEASAYLLGFFDAGGGAGRDPYIVRRFHELRAGTVKSALTGDRP